MRSPNGGFISAFYDPLKTPNAPTIGTATIYNATSIIVNYTAPSNMGASAYTQIIAIATDLSSGATFTATNGSISQTIVSGLTAGKTYTARAFFVNSYGIGPSSASSNSVTPN